MAEIEIFEDVEQGTEQWFRLRAGLPTASEFATVLAEPTANGTMANAMLDALVKSGVSAAQLAAAVKAAKSKNATPAAGRAKYLDRLAAEIITGQPDPDSYTSAAMERGHALEDEARGYYAFVKRVKPKQVAFVKRGRAGASPDALIGDDGGLEIKIAMPTVQLPRLRAGKLPTEHKAQVQGNLWISGRAWWDFMSYWPGLPPLIVRVERDEEYIARLAKAVDAFNEELDALVQAIRSFDDFKAVAA
jgi:hypothetical protein